VGACLGRYLTFGDFNGPKSEISQKIKKAAKMVSLLRTQITVVIFFKSPARHHRGLDMFLHSDNVTRCYQDKVTAVGRTLYQNIKVRSVYH
jgi:hypothetical protein